MIAAAFGGGASCAGEVSCARLRRGSSRTSPTALSLSRGSPRSAAGAQRRQERAMRWGPSTPSTRLARLLRAGVSGFVAKREPVKTLLRGVAAVASGETWAPRPATARALSGLAEEQRGAAVRLTPREGELLSLLSGGYRNKELASMLGIREQTVKMHLPAVPEASGQVAHGGGSRCRRAARTPRKSRRGPLRRRVMPPRASITGPLYSFRCRTLRRGRPSM
jgi:hypothetical protein